MTGAEDWEFAAASGERMELHVEYERGPATKGGAEVKFYYPNDPAKFQIFKTDQAIDIMRNPREKGVLYIAWHKSDNPQSSAAQCLRDAVRLIA